MHLKFAFIHRTTKIDHILPRNSKITIKTIFQKPIFCSIGVSQLVYEQTLFNHGKPEKIPEVRK